MEHSYQHSYEGTSDPTLGLLTDLPAPSFPSRIHSSLQQSRSFINQILNHVNPVLEVFSVYHWIQNKSVLIQSFALSAFNVCLLTLCATDSLTSGRLLRVHYYLPSLIFCFVSFYARKVSCMLHLLLPSSFGFSCFPHWAL